MEISLTPDLEKLVAEKVASGLYSSPNEVVSQTLKLLEWEEMPRKEQLEEFNRELQRRIDAADRGEYITGEEFESRVREKLAGQRATLSSDGHHS